MSRDFHRETASLLRVHFHRCYRSFGLLTDSQTGSFHSELDCERRNASTDATLPHPYFDESGQDQFLKTPSEAEGFKR